MFEDAGNHLPRYKSHKCVSAAKIATLLTHIDGILDLTLDLPDGKTMKMRMSSEWRKKHAPDKGGYLVLYDDGYASYSPSEAFEQGYTLIEEDDAA